MAQRPVGITIFSILFILDGLSRLAPLLIWLVVPGSRPGGSTTPIPWANVAMIGLLHAAEIASGIGLLRMRLWGYRLTLLLVGLWVVRDLVYIWLGTYRLTNPAAQVFLFLRWTWLVVVGMFFLRPSVKARFLRV